MNLRLHESAGATPLAPDELLGLKAKHITNRGELNELEEANIEQGLIWLERRPKSFDILTAETVREVHKRLFGNVWEWAGAYRLTEKNIGVPVWHISTEMRNCLDDARYWRDNDTYDPLEATARLHHKLARIHPFVDGNGRWARIIADAFLAKIDPGTYLDWSGGGSLNVGGGHRAKYIAALRAADGHEFEQLIELVRSIARKDR